MSQHEVFHRLLGAWNEPNAERRKETVRASLAAAFVYADPHRPGEMTKHEEFDEFLEIFRARVPGVEVKPGERFSQHHAYARAEFVILRGESVFAAGTYFLEFDESHRIVKMIGFLDREPGAPDSS
ncbi:MAG: hypothetical protein AAGE65_07365 [Planctomycetota bacterium]